MLLTDGEDNDEGALEAAQNAAKEGLKIFTIGIGSAEGTLVTVADAQRQHRLCPRRKGPGGEDAAERSAAPANRHGTGGFYLPLRGADTMDTLYERGLAPLPKSEGKEKLVRRYHEQFHWPLAAAMLLLLAEMFLPERQRRRRKQSPATDARQAQRRRTDDPGAGRNFIVADSLLRFAGERVARLPGRAITPTR